jgi:hypothetical protein
MLTQQGCTGQHWDSRTRSSRSFAADFASPELAVLRLLQVGASVTAAAVNRGNQQLLAIRRFAAQVGTNCSCMHVAHQYELRLLLG